MKEETNNIIKLILLLSENEVTRQMHSKEITLLFDVLEKMTYPSIISNSQDCIKKDK